MQFMKDNGNQVKDTEKENKHGKMVVYMRVIGKMEWQMDMVD